MEEMNVFSDKARILTSVPVGGDYQNPIASSSTHEPNTFGSNFISMPLTVFKDYWNKLSVSEQISLTIFDEAIRKRIESWSKKQASIDVVLGSSMIQITLTVNDRVGEMFLVQMEGYLYANGPYGAVYGNKGNGENLRSFSVSNQYEKDGEFVPNMFLCPQVCDDVRFFIEHLEAVFSGKLNTVHIDTQYWPRCSKINRKLHQCSKVIIPPTVSNETFNDFAEDFKAQHLISRGGQMAGFRPTKVISKDTYDDSGYSIQLKDLEFIDCRVISFCASCFKALHYNQVIKNWIEGKYEKMEFMIFWVSNWDLSFRYEPKIDPTEVLEGIERSEVGTVSMETIMDNIEHSVKVQRPDGRTAVVTTEGSQDKRLFHFRIVVLKDDQHVPKFNITEETIPEIFWPTKLYESY